MDTAACGWDKIRDEDGRWLWAVTGNVWAVIAERQNTDGTWTKVGVFTELNNTVVTGLVSGSTNTIRVCAMAASNQTSEWSAPMSAICT